MSTSQIESPLARLSDEQIEQLGKEFDVLHDEVFSDLGDRDRKYITSMIEMHRRIVVFGRVLLLASRYKPAWLLGTASLSAAKILENMEIGHNVMHGQWDWMNDPKIHSSTWDWDTASTKESWKHSHNYIHHTYTNIRGKDKDLGYEIMRIDPHQKWHPVYLLQPVYNALLMALFEWGVAFHDLDLEAVRSGEKSQKEVLKDLKGIAGKARLQIQKDYLAWPILSGLAMTALDIALNFDELGAGDRGGRLGRIKSRLGRVRTSKTERMAQDALAILVSSGGRQFKSTLIANATANVIRNLWAHSIIFCGHFPDQTYTFGQEETEDESRGAWYVRQLTGAANIEGGPMFHVASGNLGYQVEHHLYPDMPSTRYGEIAPRVKEICQRYELPYNTGPLHKQLGMVHRTILRLAFPGGKPRPKPGPYKGTDAASPPSRNGGSNGSTGPTGSGPERPEEGVKFSMPSDGKGAEEDAG
ncbi:MAG TPA: fatty acid desaturase [Thermoleophilaceae bacterium]|nr:fatty acid desaturase [Thermoleophilaceae bacterium]